MNAVQNYAPVRPPRHLSVRSQRLSRLSRVAVLTISLLGATMASGSPTVRDAPSQKSEPATALETAEKLVEAFNRHDAAAMGLLVTSDFELYYVDSDGVATLSTRGPEQLEREMVEYFGRRPSVQSSIVGAIDGPAFVSFREQIVGGQSSLAVYEVRSSLVRRAWYFPAEE